MFELLYLMCCILALHCLVTVYVTLFCIWLGTNKSWDACDVMYWCL